jgi:ATP/maltotriose-dependent transcriptional regulator MalT
LEMGNLPELAAESEQTIEAASKSGALLFTTIGLGFQAVAFSRLGRHQDAQRAMAASHAAAMRVGGQPMMSDWLAAANAEVAFNAGNLQDALVLAERASVRAQAVGSLFADGWAQRIWAQALAGQPSPRWELAEEHLAASLQAFERGDSRIEAARTHAVWARICRARGDIERGREHEARANAVVIL